MFYADLAALKARAFLQDRESDDSSSISSAEDLREGAPTHAEQGQGQEPTVARASRFVEIHEIIAKRGMFFV